MQIVLQGLRTWLSLALAPADWLAHLKKVAQLFWVSGYVISGPLWEESAAGIVPVFICIHSG